MPSETRKTPAPLADLTSWLSATTNSEALFTRPLSSSAMPFWPMRAVGTARAFISLEKPRLMSTKVPSRMHMHPSTKRDAPMMICISDMLNGIISASRLKDLSPLMQRSCQGLEPRRRTDGLPSPVGRQAESAGLGGGGGSGAAQGGRKAWSSGEKGEMATC